MDMIAIGQRIKLARESAHITQDGLAKQIGFSTHHLSAIERGVKTPKLETFVAIARAVGVSTDWLLQDELTGIVDVLSSDIATAIAHIPMEIQRRILRAIRAFAEEWQ